MPSVKSPPDPTLTRRSALGLVGALPFAAASSSPASAAPESSARTSERRGYADSIYGQIHYRYAKPPAGGPRRLPLLCLHASPLTGIVYDNWLVEMGRDRLALAPDTPGFGGSDAPPAPPEIGDYARAFIGFLDSLELDSVDLMGYHTGAMTAVEMARRYPHRVRKVVMISAPLFTAEELVAYRSRLLGPPPTYETLLATNLENWRRDGKGMFRDEPTDERYADISIERMRSYRISTWGHRAAFNYDLASAFPQAKQPILILNPEDDLWQMTPRAMQYAKTATMHDLPGWTHGHLDAHTAEMAAIVRAFLDKKA